MQTNGADVEYLTNDSESLWLYQKVERDKTKYIKAVVRFSKEEYTREHSITTGSHDASISPGKTFTENGVEQTFPGGVDTHMHISLTN
jgi:hypothetical protein